MAHKSLKMPLDKHDTAVLEYLKTHAACTRTRVFRHLRMKRTTVYDSLDKLIRLGLAVKYPDVVEGRGRGRPSILFDIA